MKKFENIDYVTYEIRKCGARITLTRSMIQMYKQLYKDAYEEVIKDKLIEKIIPEPSD